jgi:hypothetical protein
MNYRKFALQRMSNGPDTDSDEYKRMLRNSYGRRYNRRTSGDLFLFGRPDRAPIFGRGPRVRAPMRLRVPMSFDPVSGETTYGQRY